MANFCFKCGAPNPDGSAFCAKCGAPLPVQPQSVPAQPQAQQQYTRPSPQPQQQYAQPQSAYMQGQQAYAQAAPQYYGAQPVQKKSASKIVKRVIIIALIAFAAFIIMTIIVALLSRSTGLPGGVGDGNTYYSIGGDHVPSVGIALGEQRKVQGSSMRRDNGVEILSIDYSVPGNSQSADVSRYLDFLCDKDGFIARTDASSAQVWRNSKKPGYMVVVQADYDSKGYTITIMRGVGQVSGNGMPGGYSEGGGSGGGTGGNSSGTDSDWPTDLSELIPAGEPKSTLRQRFDIAIYEDGTVMVGNSNGWAVVTSDGTIYINGYTKVSNGKIDIPTGGSSIESNGVTVRTVDEEFFLIANGSVLYLDADGTGSAWDAP